MSEMKRIGLISKVLKVLTLSIFAHVVVLQGLAQDQDTIPSEGSYLSFGQPEIEDNSFFIEEAFNQRMGVLQHIFNVYLDDLHPGVVSYAFTQEIPLTDQGHQLSYSISYQTIAAADSTTARVAGLGDLYITYRPMISDGSQWAMCIPRLTLILPTGKSSDGLGGGAFGLQLAIAVTKRISRGLVTHYNIGSTTFFQRDRYASVNGEHKLVYERNVSDQNAGVGVVWIARPKLNFLVEGLASRNSLIRDDGVVVHEWQYMINPGVRFSITTKRMQLVPGVSFPVNPVIRSGQGVFFYFSIEPDYETFFKGERKS